jgi:hypothetical protein
MTTLNHAVTGAVIAVAVKKPLLAVPLALISHYICDVIPHFGIHEHDHALRNANRLFRVITALSVAGMFGLLIFTPFLRYQGVSWVTVMACIIAANVPDAVWIPNFIRQIKRGQEKAFGAFNRFHQAIQWYEKPLGLSVEALWLFAGSCVLWFATS